MTLPGPTLPPLVQTLALHREPLGVLRRARARHGPLFALQLTVAGPVTVAASPEAVPVLLDADPARAGAGEARRMELPMASPRSSFGGDGAVHRTARERIAGTFEPEAIDARRSDLEGGDARERVVRETLRLQPPALAALRRTSEPLEVPGGVIPAGTTAILPIPLLQRDPRAFPEPDAFLPERWTDAGEGPLAYLPFGGGSRLCIGMHLARTYFDALVPAVLGRLRLRPLARDPERMVVRATTLVPRSSGVAVARGA